MKAILPTRSIALLIGIGLIDMITTAVLHAQGKIVEMNPLMRGFLQTSEWLFILVKGATLVAAWIVMAQYAQVNRPFVRKCCIWGSVVYAGVWLGWFTLGTYA